MHSCVVVYTRFALCTRIHMEFDRLGLFVSYNIDCIAVYSITCNILCALVPARVAPHSCTVNIVTGNAQNHER